MKLLKDGDANANIPLRQGDIVYLTGNNRVDFARDIVPLINAAYLIAWIADPNRN